ncbi:hypothetical protein D3C76_1249490 [compost metagenome]
MQLQINYLDRLGRRELVVVTDTHTYKADLVKGIFQCDAKIQQINTERDFTYIEQHKAVLNSDYSSLCSFNEGVEIVDLVENIEQSAQTKRWIYNG